MYLSEVINKNQFHLGEINLVIAKTGQGKTTMAAKTLPNILEITNKQRILFLIDTNMGKDGLLKTEDFQLWGEKKNKIYLMTYNLFGKLLKEQSISVDMFDLIIADEFHNLYKYARIDEAALYHEHPEYSEETRALILSRESNAYKAMETLKRWSLIADCYVVAMTATPQQFLGKDKELNTYIHTIQQKEQLVAYEIAEKMSYADVMPLLTEETAYKRLIYAPTIQLAQRFAAIMNQYTTRKVAVLWSLSNEKYPLSAEQIAIRNYVLNNEAFPPEIDDIIITEAYTTGYNVIDNSVQEVIVHTSNQIIQQQTVGRLRQNIKVAYFYNSKQAENEKRIKRKQNASKAIQSAEWIVPEDYLNKELNKKLKEQLLKEINYPKKWTSFKKAIENSYTVEEKRTQSERYSVIMTKTGPGV